MIWPPLPAWTKIGLESVGLQEIPGRRHNARILAWLRQLGAWWSEDETPWCATFVAHCLREAGLPVPKHWYRAKAYADYGTPILRIANSIPIGSLCGKTRVGGGHIFQAVARSADGRHIYGLGGNQRNSVNITKFLLSEIDFVRWPGGPCYDVLPVVTDAEIGSVQRGSEA